MDIYGAGKGLRGPLLAATALAITSCASGTQYKAEPESSPVCDVRTDSGPVARRFPVFGAIRHTRWCAVVLNEGRGVPGPSDVRLVGVLQVSTQALRKILADDRWSFSRQAPERLPAEIRQVAPAEAPWVRDAQFDRSVTQGAYTGSFGPGLRDRPVRHGESRGG